MPDRSPTARRRATRATRGAALALALLVGSPALAGELREPVLQTLSGIEDVPTAEQLRGLGPGVEAELLEIAADTSISRSKRGRAVAALGWFPSDATRAHLDGLVGPDGDRYLARKAVFALATGWQEGALPVLTTTLASDDVQLRIATVHALEKVDVEPARAALDARLQIETNATVQATLRKALDR